jgi:hypothetical protein
MKKLHEHALPISLAFAFLTVLLLVLPGCTTTPTAPTDRQVMVANTIEDVIAIGLVPVFTKNPAYIPEARAISAALAVSTATTLAPDDIAAALAKTRLTPEDARMVAAVVASAWDSYQRRYAEQVSKTVRPDVALFLRSVSAGIDRAIAATPKSTARVEVGIGGYGVLNSFPAVVLTASNAVLTEADIKAMEYRPTMRFITTEGYMERTPAPFSQFKP